MNIKLQVFTTFVALLISSSVLADEVAARFRLLQVEDGDTLSLEMDGESVRVQLLGIDAPEDTENPKFKLDLKNTGLEYEPLMQLGSAASTHLKSLVTVGEEVTIEGVLRAKDRYGRIPAIVSNAAGRALAEAMVQDGYAVALEPTERDYAYGRRLDRLERFARKANNGLWGSQPELFRNWYDRTR